MTSFNVMHEPVLPIVGPDGAREVGIAEALRRAQEYQLAVADSMDAATVLRLLLALVLDALGQPRDEYEWSSWFAEGHFDEGKLDSYLSEHEARFDLFGPEPAWQVADLEAVSGERKPSSLLIPAAASGNNVPLFASRTESDPPPLTPGEAFLALLRVHAWDTAAIKTGAVGDPAVRGGKTMGNKTGQLGALGVVIPRGRNLFETLMLNVPLATRLRVGGKPWWRRDPETAVWTERPEVGLLDLLTWQSRRVRLFPEIDGSGTVVVREVLVCAGDRLPSTPDRLEPHTAWRIVKNPKAGQPARMPARHQSGRALWRGISALLAVRGVEGDSTANPPAALAQIGELWSEGYLAADYPLDVLAVGVEYGNQSAVVDNVYTDSLPLPVSALGVQSEVAVDIRACAEQAENLRRALNDLESGIRRSTGADPVPWDKGDHPGDAMMAAFDGPFRELLHELQQNPDDRDEAVEKWRATARHIVHSAAIPVLAAASPTGFLGRKDGKQHHTVPREETFFLAAVKKTVGADSTQEEVRS